VSVSTGRFAPSPTGPLHLGSLVAAVGSWLFARAAGGRWLVRMEDLDTPRVVPGAADDILRTLERLGLTWDGEIVFQSERNEAYEGALRILRMKERLFPCACTRSELAHTASAPDRSDGSVATVYPGTCRAGLPPGKEAHAIRFRVPAGVFTFEDLVLGSFSEDVAAAVGDFVVKRADGPFAYQLAVVVDDAAHGVTEVVRGADLLDSTARQIALQRAFDFPTPSYAHLPLVLGPAGKKLGKKHGALPLETLDEARIRGALAFALSALGQEPAAGPPREMLEEARRRFDPSRIPREPRRAPG
jgi:glutamyl-Q tRNA(Asp) synthetase